MSNMDATGATARVCVCVVVWLQSARLWQRGYFWIIIAWEITGQK
jgi:hypothetical protein